MNEELLKQLIASIDGLKSSIENLEGELKTTKEKLALRMECLENAIADKELM
jgi:hypothetical protein